MRSKKSYLFALMNISLLLLNACSKQTEADLNSSSSNPVPLQRLNQFNPNECEKGGIILLTDEKTSVQALSTLKKLNQLNMHHSAKHLFQQKNGMAAQKLHRAQRIVYLKIDDDNVDTQQYLDDLNQEAGVIYAEPNCNVYATTNTNDPFLTSNNNIPAGDLWGIHSVEAPDAWDFTQGEGVTVAVLDTGIHPSHVDLIANLYNNPNEIANNGIDDDGNGFIDDIRGWDFVSNDNNPQDGYHHGTHVAGTIAAVGNNNTGVVGVSYKSKLAAVKVLSDAGSGTTPDIVAGIMYAADQKFKVLNMSLGGPGYSQAHCDAIDYAVSKGSVVVVSAGNSNADAANFTPANCTNAVTVASHTSSNSKSFFSNFGNIISVSAPGSSILSTRNTSSDYEILDGTSMASPHVAGVAALIASVNPSLSPEQIKTIMQDTAKDFGSPGFDTSFGHGAVNAYEAVQMAQSPAFTEPSIELEDIGSTPGSHTDTLTYTVNIGDTVHFNVNVSSPNNLDVNIVTQGIPSGANFTPATGEFLWLVDSNAYSNNSLQFSAQIDTGTKTLNVIIHVVDGDTSPPPVNGDPTLNYESFIASNACASQSSSAGLSTLLLLACFGFLLLKQTKVTLNHNKH